MAPLRQEVVGLCLLETQPAEAHALHVDVERADERVGARSASELDEEAGRDAPQLEIGTVDRPYSPTPHV